MVIENICRTCKLYETNNRGSLLCILRENPFEGRCDNYVKRQSVAQCSECGRETTDWDFFGAGRRAAHKKIVCRDCLCPEYDACYTPYRSGRLSEVMGDDQFGRGISYMGDQITKKQDEMGIPRVKFPTNGLA